ncbi:MAG: hypothetical protein P4L87_03410 [Formivibrio sp.]|nr:hypothetical protein [Formivibrio sp.]
MKNIAVKYEDGRWRVRIKEGRKWGSWHTKAGEWHNGADARAGGKAMLAKYREANPEPVVLRILDPKLDPKKSFRAVYQKKMEEYWKRQGTRNESPHKSAAKHLMAALGAHAEVEPKSMKPKWFAPVRERLLERLSGKTPGMYAQRLREVLGTLVPLGLDPLSIGELDRMPSGKSSDTAGFPFSMANIKVMMKLEPNQSDTTRMLLWGGASGGPQAVDLAFLPFAGFNDATGVCRWKRTKVNETIEFAALPPLQDLIKKRQAELGEGAVYVFPELIFLDEEIGLPKTNTVFWKRPPENIAKRAAQNVNTVVTEFLTLCGIKAEGYTNKSWRIHDISLWSALGVKDKTRLRMAGHKTLDQHRVYEVPSEIELVRVKDIMWQYYGAIREGRDFFIPSTPYDIYEAIMKRWDQFPEVMQRLVHEELTSSSAKLELFIQAAFESQQLMIQAGHAEILATVRAESADLKRDNELLREQVAAVLANQASQTVLLKQIAAANGVEAEMEPAFA